MPKSAISIILFVALTAATTYAQWTEPMQVTDYIGWMDTRAAAIGDTIHAVGSIPRAFSYVHSYDNGTTWSEPTTPLDTFYQCTMPDIIYSKGKTHITYIDQYTYSETQDIFHISSSDGGQSWSAPHQVFHTRNNPLLEYPRLAANGDTLFLSCLVSNNTNAYILVFTSFNGGETWGDSSVAEPIAWEVLYPPSVLYSAGQLHLIYEMGIYNDSSNIEVYYRRSLNWRRRWTARIPLSTNDAIASQGPEASADSSGHIIATWFDHKYGSNCNGIFGDILARISTDNGDSWLPESRLTNTQTGIGPSCKIVNNFLHAVWMDGWPLGCSYPKIMYSKSSDWGASWTTPEVITGSSEIYELSPALTYSLQGNTTTFHCLLERYQSGYGGALYYLQNEQITGINDYSDLDIPSDLSMAAYPNPFNSNTIITFSNPEGGDLEIGIYDLMGRQVRTFNLIGAKEGEIKWDARDAMGNRVSTGIYFARARTMSGSEAIKLIYLK